MADQLPKRKNVRLKNYNYNWTSSYFLTICAKDMECIFGKVIKKYIENDNKSAIEQKIAVDAYVKLSDIGKIALKYVESSKTAYENIEVENFVIMPNHIHLLIYVSNENTDSCPPNASVPKYVSVLKRLINKECGYNVFQRSYHDHIVRGDKDFEKIWDYIQYNPHTWDKDCFYMKSELPLVGDGDPDVPRRSKKSD